jgi:hypothetical protein
VSKRSKELEKARDLIKRYQLRELLERVRRAHVDDMAANDMSDPHEPPDPYFNPLPEIGQSYLLHIRALYRQAFDGGPHHFSAADIDVIDAAGSSLAVTNSPARAKLLTELLSFAAHISKDDPE